MFASRLVSSSSNRAYTQSARSFHSPFQNQLFTVCKPQTSTLSPSPNQHLKTLVNGFHSLRQSPNKAFAALPPTAIGTFQRVGVSSSASGKKSLGDDGEQAKRGGDAKSQSTAKTKSAGTTSSTVPVRNDLEGKRVEEYTRWVNQKEKNILLVVLNRLKARTRGVLALPRPPEIAI